MRRSVKSALVAALAGSLFVTVPALAQGGGGGGGGGRGGEFRQGFGGGMAQGAMGQFQQPVMNSRDLTRYAEILTLDADQKEAAKALLDGYSQELNLKREEMQEKMREAREAARAEGGGGGGFGAFRELGQKFQQEKKTLDETFMSDLKGLLTPEQEAAWPKFERTHRREQSIGRGFVSGERMDVIRLVEEAELSPEDRAKVSEILARYEEDLDRELIAREQVQQSSMQKMMELREGGDMEAMQKIIEDGRAASVRVRDINRKYAREVQGQLPEAAQFGFAKAVKEASFPRVYSPTFGQRTLETASGLAGLDATQKETIQTISANYNRDLAVLNDKMAAAQEKAEMDFNIGRMAGGGGRDQGELGELRQQRRELEDAMMENLSKVLTEEQRARLPKREEGRGGEGGRRQMEEGEGGRREQDGGRQRRQGGTGREA